MLLISILLTFISINNGVKFRDRKRISTSVNDLFENFFSWRLSSSPEFATDLGIEGYDDKLGKEMSKK